MRPQSHQMICPMRRQGKVSKNEKNGVPWLVVLDLFLSFFVFHPTTGMAKNLTNNNTFEWFPTTKRLRWTSPRSSVATLQRYWLALRSCRRDLRSSMPTPNRPTSNLRFPQKHIQWSMDRQHQEWVAPTILGKIVTIHSLFIFSYLFMLQIAPDFFCEQKGVFYGGDGLAATQSHWHFAVLVLRASRWNLGFTCE